MGRERNWLLNMSRLTHISVLTIPHDYRCLCDNEYHVISKLPLLCWICLCYHGNMPDLENKMKPNARQKCNNVQSSRYLCL